MNQEQEPSRAETVRAVYSLVLVTRSTMRRAMYLLVAVGALVLGAVVLIALATMFIHRQTALVNDLLSEQKSTRATAERASDKASAVESELDARPTLEVRSAASGSAGKPGAVVIVHPPKGRGIPVPTASAVEVPATLPDGGLP
jgi:hypothetical protein